MKTHAILIASTLILAACAEAEVASDDTTEETAEETTDATDGATSADEELMLTAQGYGPLQIGMTRAEVVAAMGDNPNPEGSGLPEPEMCDEFQPERAPDGLYVMIEGGNLARITLSETRDIGTQYGLLIGSPASAVREAYGDRVQAMTHNYLGEPAEYLDIWEGDVGGAEGVSDAAARGIRYETDENRNVQFIHAGGPAIQYIEGCL